MRLTVAYYVTPACVTIVALIFATLFGDPSPWSDLPLAFLFFYPEFLVVCFLFAKLCIWSALRFNVINLWYFLIVPSLVSAAIGTAFGQANPRVDVLIYSLFGLSLGGVGGLTFWLVAYWQPNLAVKRDGILPPN
jgi:hypothetical protein